MPSPRIWFWGLALSAFLASLLTVTFVSGQTFVSPDENGAFTFAKQFATTASFTIAEPLNDQLGGLLHPRSAIGYGAGIVPATFLGFLLLTGLVGSVFGSASMLLITPVLAVLAILAWRQIVAKLFADPLLADLAAFLLMIHPAFWYYSGRVMMHNVAFIALLIFALWFVVVVASHRRETAHRAVSTAMAWAMAGICVGAALFIRLSEAPWVIGLTVALFAWSIWTGQRPVPTIGWRSVASFVCGLGLMIGLQGLFNNATYGAPWLTGYTASYGYETVDTAVAVDVDDAGRGPIDYLLPFGFHERAVMNNVWDYGIWLYPIFSLLTLVGVGLVIAEQASKKRPILRLLSGQVGQNLDARPWIAVTITFLALAAWLGIVYGSWNIFDNPDATAVTIGNSHVRYWLPVFVPATLIAAWPLRRLLELCRPPLTKGGPFDFAQGK